MDKAGSPNVQPVQFARGVTGRTISPPRVQERPPIEWSTNDAKLSRVRTGPLILKSIPLSALEQRYETSDLAGAQSSGKQSTTPANTMEYSHSLALAVELTERIRSFLKLYCQEESSFQHVHLTRGAFGDFENAVDALEVTKRMGEKVEISTTMRFDCALRLGPIAFQYIEANAAKARQISLYSVDIDDLGNRLLRDNTRWPVDQRIESIVIDCEKYAQYTVPPVASGDLYLSAVAQSVGNWIRLARSVIPPQSIEVRNRISTIAVVVKEFVRFHTGANDVHFVSCMPTVAVNGDGFGFVGVQRANDESASTTVQLIFNDNADFMTRLFWTLWAIVVAGSDLSLIEKHLSSLKLEEVEWIMLLLIVRQYEHGVSDLEPFRVGAEVLYSHLVKGDSGEPSGTKYMAFMVGDDLYKPGVLATELVPSIKRLVTMWARALQSHLQGARRLSDAYLGEFRQIGHDMHLERIKVTVTTAPGSEETKVTWQKGLHAVNAEGKLLGHTAFNATANGELHSIGGYTFHGTLLYDARDTYQSGELERVSRMSVETGANTEMNVNVLLAGRYGVDGALWALGLIQQKVIHVTRESRCYVLPYATDKENAITVRVQLMPAAVASINLVTDGTNLYYRAENRSFLISNPSRMCLELKEIQATEWDKRSWRSCRIKRPIAMGHYHGEICDKP